MAPSDEELSRRLRARMIEVPDFSDARSMINCLEAIITELKMATLEAKSGPRQDTSLDGSIAASLSMVSDADGGGQTSEETRRLLLRLSDLESACDSERETLERRKRIYEEYFQGCASKSREDFVAFLTSLERTVADAMKRLDGADAGAGDASR